MDCTTQCSLCTFGGSSPFIYGIYARNSTHAAPGSWLCALQSFLNLQLFNCTERQITPPHFPWESLQRRRQTHPFQSEAYYSVLQSCSSGRAGPERALICALLLCSPQSQTTRVPGARLKILKALLNNKYFISPESHTQLQMAKTKVSHFNENLISHMKRCLWIPGGSSM